MNYFMIGFNLVLGATVARVFCNVIGRIVLILLNRLSDWLDQIEKEKE